MNHTPQTNHTLVRKFDSIEEEQDAHYAWLSSLSYTQRLELAVSHIKRMYPNWCQSPKPVLRIIKS